MKSTVSTRAKRIATFLIAFVMMVACVFELALPASAASWRTGNVPTNSRNTGAITVTLTNKNKDAYIKIHTYAAKNRFEGLKANPQVKERNCTLDVTMRDTNGKWIWENRINTGSGGKKMKLGKDHAVYKLYLKHTYSVRCWDVGHYCPVYWGVECVSNCSVK